MDHLFHFFGGGCGEHLLIPGLASASVGLTLARHWLKAQWRRLFGGPETFTHDGKLYVDGRDYFGKHDRLLIEQHGEQALNFCPSTPPKYR